MVFSSSPIYLDPPNWHQQQNQLPGDACENLQLPPLPPPTSGGGGGQSIRPISMSERARLAKIAQPEAALKCPRCDSTNTKFCYFNNYSLTQPRHFCKTCRRYWTRGGALRSVPVGGGCRRNKRTKGNNRSKSPSKAGSSSTTGLISSSDILGHSMPAPQLPILPPLHQLSDFSSVGVGLNYGGIQPTGGGVMDFQIGGTNSGGNFMSNGLADHLRFQQVQQFPYLVNLGPENGSYFNEGEGVGTPNYVGQFRSKPLDMATVKMEEDHRQLGSKLPKHMFGNESNGQYLSGNPQFTDLSGFTSSSSSHLL